MTLALGVILRVLCSSRVEPAALRVRRVRLNLSTNVRTQDTRSPCCILVSWIVSSTICWDCGLVTRRVGWALVTISRLILEDMGSIAGLSEVTAQPGSSLNVVNLEQIMHSPSDEDIRTLVESSCDETMIERRRRNLVSTVNLCFPFPGLANDSTCLRLNCCHVSRVSHLGVVPKFHSGVMLLCL